MLAQSICSGLQGRRAAGRDSSVSAASTQPLRFGVEAIGKCGLGVAYPGVRSIDEPSGRLIRGLVIRHMTLLCRGHASHERSGTPP